MPLLVVEDKDSLRLMLRKTLEGEGYETDTAKDGKEAQREKAEAGFGTDSAFVVGERNIRFCQGS